MISGRDFRSVSLSKGGFFKKKESENAKSIYGIAGFILSIAQALPVAMLQA